MMTEDVATAPPPGHRGSPYRFPPMPPAPPPPATGPLPVPAGAPYHRLARTVAHRWWRPLAGTGLVLAGMVVLSVAVVIVGLTTTVIPEESTGLTPLEALADTSWVLLAIAMTIPAVLVAARLVQRRRAGTVSSVTGRLRLRWLGWCALVAAGACVVQLTCLVLLTGWDGDDTPVSWVGGGTMALSAAVLVVLVPLQAAGEEYLARGWFVQAVGSWTRSPWPGIVAGGAVWTLLHVPSTVWGAAGLMLYSAVLGWLTVRTGGLEAAIALHAVTNTVIFLIQAAVGQLADDTTAGDAGWQLLVADAAAFLLFVPVVLALHRRFRLARLS